MRAFNTGREIVYPAQALYRYGAGAVVMHFALQPDGSVRARTIAASIPPGPLAEAVEATLPNWQVEKAANAPASCRVPSSYYFVVRFVLR
jgi:outer membrane biosynthesis protein TonB